MLSPTLVFSSKERTQQEIYMGSHLQYYGRLFMSIERLLKALIFLAKSHVYNHILL